MYKLLNRYRRELTQYDSILAYSLLGIFAGLTSGLVVLAFEQAIVEIGRLWGFAGSTDSFENLPQWAIFALPTGGALVLGLAYAGLRPEDRETGIVHVLSRMHSHYSVLPIRNAVVQFIGGAFALATGQSGGREGPGVHVGGAINSVLGQRLGLPNNSLRILIACGAAGGIAAAFNTPLAGVIFAMEVIIAEYTVVGFIPVMMSAAVASVISRNLSEGGAVFFIPVIELNSMWEIPFIVLLGICCGASGAAFVRLTKSVTSLSQWPVVPRFVLAGAFTGALGLLVPEVLGMGYDTLALLLEGEVALRVLLVLAACKLLATAVSCGAGLPVGLIGPNLLIGACLGGALGIAGNLFQPELASGQNLYVVIGMAAAMAAVLNAPLAGILAVIEMTDSASIAMPALLAIVAATLTHKGIFRQRSAHQMILRQLQRSAPDNPLNQLLHRTDVASTMDSRVVRVPIKLESEHLEPLLEHTPTWCLIEREGEDLYLVQGSDLLDWLKEHSPDADSESDSVDLADADIRRWAIAPVPVQATLRQAMDTIRSNTAEVACVYGRSQSGSKRILHGVVTRDSIEKFSLDRL